MRKSATQIEILSAPDDVYATTKIVISRFTLLALNRSTN